MSIHPKLKAVLYGFSVFVIFVIFVIVLRKVTNHIPTEFEYFNLISKKDILLGLLLAIVLTFTHERKKKLK